MQWQINHPSDWWHVCLSQILAQKWMAFLLLVCMPKQSWQKLPQQSPLFVIWTFSMTYFFSSSTNHQLPGCDLLVCMQEPAWKFVLKMPSETKAKVIVVFECNRVVSLNWQTNIATMVEAFKAWPWLAWLIAFSMSADLVVVRCPVREEHLVACHFCVFYTIGAKTSHPIPSHTHYGQTEWTFGLMYCVWGWIQYLNCKIQWLLYYMWHLSQDVPSHPIPPSPMDNTEMVILCFQSREIFGIWFIYERSLKALAGFWNLVAVVIFPWQLYCAKRSKSKKRNCKKEGNIKSKPRNWLQKPN